MRDKPITNFGQRLLDQSWWDAGMRGHFSRIWNPGGPEDMRNIIIQIENEVLGMLAPVVVVTHEEDASWSVEIAAMPGHVGAGETLAQAASEAHDAALAWLEAEAQKDVL